jgi:hypothetical protein
LFLAAHLNCLCCATVNICTPATEDTSALDCGTRRTADWRAASALRYVSQCSQAPDRARLQGQSQRFIHDERRSKETARCSNGGLRSTNAKLLTGGRIDEESTSGAMTTWPLRTQCRAGRESKSVYDAGI